MCSCCYYLVCNWCLVFVQGPYKMDNEAKTELNGRQILYEYWARWSRWYKYQPVHHIREYFGEKIGIYFVWLGLYISSCVHIALAGQNCKQRTISVQFGYGDVNGS